MPNPALARAPSTPSRSDNEPSREAAVAAEVAALADLDLHGLRVRWRKLFRKQAPAHLSRALLVRILAYRVQANAFGDLDRETARFLDRIARQRRAGDKSPIPPVAETRTLKVGAQLVREHDGVLHRVTVAEGGYAWAGTTYRSLSEVARAITGTRWNGPRFFGLRDRPTRSTSGDEA
jgi:hypothetical protein